MASVGFNPLNQTHCDICTRILSTIQEPINVVRACIECGMPAQEMLDELLRIQRTAQAIKAKFFPTAP